jgi:hypothetical protein
VDILILGANRNNLEGVTERERDDDEGATNPSALASKDSRIAASKEFLIVPSN